MSLGIIVMHFAWIVQRLVSSRSTTKYASAASCRVRMMHTWKCMSYFPTLSHRLNVKKGEVMYEEVHTFLKLTDLMEGHYPWLVPLGFLHLSSLKEFLLGGLASHGQLELPLGWLLPT